MRFGKGVKRGIDIVLGTALLVVLSPVVLGVAVAILATSGRPVFFRQRRPGRYGIPWTMVKFRTMRPPKHTEDIWRSDHDRLTRIGVLLRKGSLDELPTLIHVVSGRMSLVGPRPLLMRYMPRYSAAHSRRHDMRPGVTGLAQVSGRCSLTLGQRLDLDIEYIDNWSLRLDCAILLRTITVVFQREDICESSLDEIDDVGLLSKSG